MKPLVVPILAAVTYAASILYAKVALTRKRISIRDYIPGTFLFLSLFSILSLIKWGGIDYALLGSGNNLMLLGSIIVIATVWNVLYYIGLSKEKVNTTEGIIILMPLLTIVMSWFFTPENISLQIAALTVGATAIIAWVYRPRSLLKFDIYSLMLLAAVILMALENVLASQILKSESISPSALYTIRTTLIFFIFFFYYRPSLFKLSSKTVSILALSGFIGTSSMILRFYGLRDAGVTVTAIVLILVPIIVLGSAVIWLHEKIKFSKVLAMLVIGALILYATFINYDMLSGK